MDKKQTAQLLKLINQNYPANKYEVSPMLIDLWHACLGHYDIEMIQQAAYRTFTRKQFPPTVADIVNEVKGMFNAGLPSEGEAWEQVDYAKDLGRIKYPYKDWTLADKYVAPIVKRAVELMGGWEAVDRSNNLDIFRSQFVKFYRELKERTIDEQTMAPAMRDRVKQLGYEAQRSLTGSTTGKADERVAAITLQIATRMKQ